MVLALSPELIEDIRKAPDDLLSGTAHTAEVRMLPRRLTFIHKVMSVPPIEIYVCFLGVK